LTCDRRLPAPKVPVAAAASYIPLDPLKDHSEVSLCIILIFAAIDIICPRGLPCLRSSRYLNPVWVTGTGHGLGHDKGVLELLRFWSRPNLTQYMKVSTNRHFLHLSCITSFSFSALPLSSRSSLEALAVTESFLLILFSSVVERSGLCLLLFFVECFLLWLWLASL
jgi:hypothetical protein